MCLPAQTEGHSPADSRQTVTPSIFVPNTSTLVILFEMASMRLMACSHGAGVLTNARLLQLTEEINKVSDEIRAATHQVQGPDIGRTGSIDDLARYHPLRP